MTIGGPSGPGGPGGPGGIDGPRKPARTEAVTGDTEVSDIAADADVAGPAGAGGVGGAGGIDVRQLADEIAAGRLTPREAIDRLVEATAGPGLGAAERAELRALLTDVIANDPVLSALVGRI